MYRTITDLQPGDLFMWDFTYDVYVYQGVTTFPKSDAINHAWASILGTFCDKRFVLHADMQPCQQWNPCARVIPVTIEILASPVVTQAARFDAAIFLRNLGGRK